MLRTLHRWFDRTACSPEEQLASSSAALASNKRARRRRKSLALEPLETRTLMAVDVAPTYHVDNSWTSGFQAGIDLANRDAATLKSWSLEFDLAAQITSIWNAKVVSQSGNHYTIAGASWDADLPAGGTVGFGFVANASAVATPSHYSINSTPIGVPTPPPLVLPKLSINDVSLSEGNAGTTNATLTVSLSSASTSSVSVAFATTAGNAASGTDFTATSGTLIFAPVKPPRRSPWPCAATRRSSPTKHFRSI